MRGDKQWANEQMNHYEITHRDERYDYGNWRGDKKNLENYSRLGLRWTETCRKRQTNEGTGGRTFQAGGIPNAEAIRWEQARQGGEMFVWLEDGVCWDKRWETGPELVYLGHVNVDYCWSSQWSCPVGTKMIELGVQQKG